MNIEWEKYKAFLIDKLPSYGNKLNPPADPYEIQYIQDELGVVLPKDFVDMYAINDGEVNSYRPNEWGIICGAKMLTTKQINEYWEYLEIDSSTTKWLPLFRDFEGRCYIGMDLSQSPAETYGQITCFFPYLKEKNFVIASSLSTFFKSINDLIESGYLYYSVTREVNNEISVYDIREYFEHTAEDLAELVKKRYNYDND